MAQENKKGLSTNSNAYTLIYAAVMVIIVAFLLSFVSSVLKDRQVENEKIDKKSQILAAINVSDSDVNAAYEKYITKDIVLDANGNAKAENGGFDVDFNKQSASDNQPLYQCTVNGATKNIVPLKGQGLWGQIWGYVALDDDKSTIYGIYFNHEGETPGLGADIVTDKFCKPFEGKHIKSGNDILSVAVLKSGVKSEVAGQEQVDALSGATLTCNGVNSMLKNSLESYKNFLTK